MYNCETTLEKYSYITTCDVGDTTFTIYICESLEKLLKHMNTPKENSLSISRDKSPREGRPLP